MLEVEVDCNEFLEEVEIKEEVEEEEILFDVEVIIFGLLLVNFIGVNVLEVEVDCNIVVMVLAEVREVLLQPLMIVKRKKKTHNLNFF